jgi:3-oxoacyl-[acyl-carrier protein] reductase
MTNEKFLAGKNALITGTNRGIGNQILHRFAEAGANVWAHARIETPEFVNECRHLSELYGVEVSPLCFELTDTEAMKSAVKVLRSYLKPVDILVNNAGITYNALFQMSSEEELRREFEVNFFSMFRLTQYISKLMVRQKSGSIVNISSTAALDCNPGKSVYGSTKAAVICMSRVIAAELGSQGIRCNCVAPGVTDTTMLGSMSESVVEDAVANTDLKRLGNPGDIASAVAYLASDRASYITGQVLRVDGGLVR